MIDPFQLPPLLYILCAMSAMAFVTSASLWMLNAYRLEKRALPKFSDAVWRGQRYSIFCVMIISIILSFYDHFSSNTSVQIWGEIIILLAGLYMAYTKNALFQQIQSTFMFGCFCLSGWGLTFVIGYVLSLILSIVPTFSSEDFTIILIFVTGLLWNAPILYWGRKILMDGQKRAVLKGQSPHTYLWPVMLAYLVLLVPFTAQEVVNSDGWKDMKKPKAPKHVEIQNFMPYLLYKV